MSDETSPRLVLPFLAAGQAQKEMTHNEALQILDALVQPVVLSADLGAPPATRAVGACWIVAGDGDDDWADRGGQIAQWTAGGWRFLNPMEGWRCHVLDRDAAVMYSAGAWCADSLRADGLYIAGNKVLGSRMAGISSPIGGMTVDSEARGAINDLLTVMRTHGLIGV